MKEENQKLLIFGAVAIVIIIFGNQLMEALGLKDTKNERDQEKNLGYKWLLPTAFIKYKAKTGLTVPKIFELQAIPKIVDNIWDAKGFFNDDEERLFSQFRRLQSKMQSSALAYYFAKEKGRDMNSYLETFLNADEIAKIKEIISSKPENVPNFFNATTI